VKAVAADVGVPRTYCDKEALVDCARGDSEVKSVRHMEQKMSSCGEEDVKCAVLTSSVYRKC
jgi:hypothetical protein